MIEGGAVNEGGCSIPDLINIVRLRVVNSSSNLIIAELKIYTHGYII